MFGALMFYVKFHSLSIIILVVQYSYIYITVATILELCLTLSNLVVKVHMRFDLGVISSQEESLPP